MRIGHPFALAGLAALALAGLLNVLTFIPPLQDFNEWIAHGQVIGALLRGEDLAFGLKPWPVPNAAAQMILGGLNLGLPPLPAGLLYLTAYLAGFGWLAWRIAWREGGFEPASFLILVVVGVLSSPYWDGYANYQLGLALLLVHALLQRRPGGSGGWTDLTLGIAIFFCHAIVLAVFCMLVGWRALLQRHILRGALVLAPPLLLLAWYVAADENYGEYIPPIGTTLREFVAYKGYTLAKSGPYHNMVIGGVGDAARAPALYVAGIAANLLFALLALLPVIAATVLDVVRRRQWTPAHLTALCCFAAYAVLPAHMFGVVNIGERFLLPGLLIGLAAASDPWRLRRLGAAVAMLAPAMVVYFHLVMPQAAPAREADHLAITDPSARLSLLFWHRPFQFHEEIEAARRGQVVRLGFTTSILRARPVAP